MEALKYQLDLPSLFPVLPWVPRRTLHKSKCDLEGPYKVERTSIQPVKISKVWMDVGNKWKKTFAMTNLWIVVSWPESQRNRPPEVRKAGLINNDNVNFIELCQTSHSAGSSDLGQRAATSTSWKQPSVSIKSTMHCHFYRTQALFLSTHVSRNHWEHCQTFQIKPIG